MGKTMKLKVVGLEEHMTKVQDIMHKKGAKSREIWPRVKYTDDPEGNVHFEMVYEVKDSKIDDFMRNRRLKRYCTGMTTLEDK